MKKFFQIILGISFLFLLVGCSSQESVTYTQGSKTAEFFVTYTYDKKNDTVTKFKIETTESDAIDQVRKENEELFATLKGIDGVVTSITEKDGKLISTIEIDLTKNKFSKLKESDNAFISGLIRNGYLAGDGDNVLFSKSKEAPIKQGFKEQTKK